MPANDLNALRGLLGLCKRAGKLQSGVDITVSAIRAGKAHLALIDEGVTPNTVKKISNACIYYHVPLLTLPKDMLGAAVGQDSRMAAAVTDAGFAARMQSMISGGIENQPPFITKTSDSKKPGGASVE